MHKEHRVPIYHELLSVYITIFGALFLVASPMVKSYTIASFGILIFALGCYLLFNVHSAIILKKEGSTITLNTRKETIRLNTAEIVWLQKMVRFTITEKYLVMVKARRSNHRFPKYYLFKNCPVCGFVNLFKGMGVKFRNFPE